MTARKPSSSNLRKWTCTMLVAMLATTPIYPPSSGAESGVREEPRPAAAPADRTIPLSGPGARPSVCQVPSVPGPDRSELPVIGESLPGSWRRDLKYQKPRRLAPGESGGTYISPQGPGPVHPEGRWLPGYRPVTAEASQDPRQVVDRLVFQLLQARPARETRAWLIDQAGAVHAAERSAVVAHLVMSLPEYQLC